MNDERWLEQLAEAADLDTAPPERAPARLKSQIYSALVSKQSETGPLLSLAATKAAGSGLCVFEQGIVSLPVGDGIAAMNPCRVCHARVLAERVDHAPVFWPHSVGTNQTANCWVIVTPNGRFAYVTNTGSGSISGYAIAFDGTIELLDADGRTAATGDGSAPIDLALTDSGCFLYSLHSGTNTIGAFRVQSVGSLTRLPFTGGLPSGANGLAAR
jgi:hypothetical protein